MGYAKQAGFTWLKVCLFGARLKQLGMWKFEFDTGGVDGGAFCEEVNNLEANIQRLSLAHLYNNWVTGRGWKKFEHIIEKI